MDNDKVKLYEFILDQYSLSELKDLCFYLDVTYDDLEGGARKDKARELVEYMTRRKRLDDLRAVLNQQRPDAYRGEFATTPALPVATPITTSAPRNPRQIFISHAAADSGLPVTSLSSCEAPSRAPWACTFSRSHETRPLKSPCWIASSSPGRSSRSFSHNCAATVEPST